MAVGQEQEDVGADADFRVGMLALGLQQRATLVGLKDDAASHGSGLGVLINEKGFAQLYGSRLLSLLWGVI